MDHFFVFRHKHSLSSAVVDGDFRQIKFFAFTVFKNHLDRLFAIHAFSGGYFAFSGIHQLDSHARSTQLSHLIQFDQ